MKMASSISRKLIWMNMLVSGAVLLLACIAFMAYDVITFRESIERNLTIQAGIIGSNSISALVFDDPSSAEKTLAALKDAPSIVSAGVYAANGSLFAGYRRQPASPMAAMPALGVDQTQLSVFHDRQIGLVRRITFEGKPIGIVHLESDVVEMTSRMWRYGFIVGTVLLLSMCAALVISGVSQRAISGPIEQLADTARRVSVEKDYALRATSTRTDDELGILITAFNEMLAQIQQHDQSLQEARDQLETRVQERTTSLNMANKELEAFSYSVSHDLRAPLRHIVGFAGMLDQRAGEQLDEQSQRYLKTIGQAATRMGRLIDDLLAFSKTGRAELIKRRVSLTALVQEAQAEVVPGAADRNVVWTVGALPDVSGDHALLKLAMVNLLSNALKYTGTRASAHIEVGIQPPVNGEVVVFVRDNGVGFDMTYVDKLFGVFQRLHGDEFSGTGIGLANVQRIVRRHGGRTWAEGAIDEGATFYFSLPTTEVT
jgi:signal transduction histidine kinase